MIVELQKYPGTIEIDIYLTADGYVQAEQFNIGGEDPENASMVSLKELVEEFLHYACDGETGRLSTASIGDAFALEAELEKALERLQDALYED